MDAGCCSGLCWFFFFLFLLSSSLAWFSGNECFFLFFYLCVWVVIEGGWSVRVVGGWFVKGELINVSSIRLSCGSSPGLASESPVVHWSPSSSPGGPPCRWPCC